jgi:hypothetical protein
MKRPLIALFFLACLPLLYGQKTRAGQKPPYAKPGVDYPVKVHISGIRIRHDCEQGTCWDAIHADAVVDQKKLELTGGFLYQPHYYQLNLLPGDYAARFLRAKKGATAPLFDEYELLLPDRHVWRCAVTGIFE